MKIKKNLSLIIGISVPIAMVLLIGAVIYLPRFFVHPKYDFVYFTESAYSGYEQYEVKDGKLVKNDTSKPGTHEQEVKLYIYHVDTDQSQEISYTEGQELNLDPSRLSPDDFEIVSGSHSDGFSPFSDHSSSDYCSRYISGHNMSRKLELRFVANSYSYYCGGFRFLGWIE